MGRLWRGNRDCWQHPPAELPLPVQARVCAMCVTLDLCTLPYIEGARLGGRKHHLWRKSAMPCPLAGLNLKGDPSKRIIKSKNHLDWKRPLRSSSPTVNLTLPSPPLNHFPKCHISTSFKYLQGWWLNHFPGQPVPMLDNPFREDIFPDIRSKPPLVQLEDVSSHPEGWSSSRSHSKLPTMTWSPQVRFFLGMTTGYWSWIPSSSEGMTDGEDEGFSFRHGRACLGSGSSRSALHHQPRARVLE